MNSLVSVVNQKVEILFIDGKSSDNTLEVIKKYNFFNSNVISEDDKGVYDAMNKGVDLSKGEWLYFLGTDDRILADGFNKAVQMLDTIRCDIFYGNVTAEHIDGDYKDEFDFKRLLNQNICHQGIFYRKSVFKNVGLYDLRYKYWADYEFNLRCFVKSTISWLYIPLGIAYHAPGGLSSSIRRDDAFDNDLIKNINTAIEQPFLIRVKMLYYLYAFCFENHGFFISAKRLKFCWAKNISANVISFLLATLSHALNRLSRK